MASSRARRSTLVMSLGTQTTTRGRTSREGETCSTNQRIIRSVTSASEITPSRSGRTAVTDSGVRPSISLARCPAATSWLVPVRTATTDGSSSTTPRPRS